MSRLLTPLDRLNAWLGWQNVKRGDFVMFSFIFTGLALAVFTLLLNWCAYVADNSIASQDMPADLVCYQNYTGMYLCEHKDELLFPHLYN
jgi:hypothetical protein